MSINRSGFIKHAGIGILIYFLVNILFAGLLAYMISKEVFELSLLSYFVPLIQLIAAAGSSFYICKVENDKRLIKCLVLAGISLLLQISITVLFFSSEFDFSLVSIIILLLGYIGVSLVHNKKKRSPNTRRYKY